MRRRIGNPVTDEFLHEVDRAARALPRGRRNELLDDLEAHLREAVAEAGGDEAQLRTIVDSLGSPDEIVAAAGPPEPRRELAGRDLAAVLLLLLGGFLAGIGWLAGVVLLWASTAWSVPQKLLGTLVFPGGLVGVLFLLGIGLSTTGSCIGGGGIARVVQTPTSPRTVTHGLPEHCTGGSSVPGWVAVIVLAALVLGPILTAVYLAQTGRRPQTA